MYSIKTIITILILIISTSLYGQKVLFGIQAGGHLSSLHTSDKTYNGFDPKIGYRFGIQSKIKLGNKSNFLPELVYSNDGVKYKNPTIALHINRISLPLLIGYQLNENFSLNVGPELNFFVNLKTTSWQSPWLPTLYNKTDFGVGLGLDVKLYKGLHASVKNYFGLIYLNELTFTDKDGNLTGAVRTDRSNVLAFSLKYYLSKKIVQTITE